MVAVMMEGREDGCEVDPSNSIANLLQMLLTEITIYD